MYGNETAVTRGSESVLATNKVLRNTYMLLSLTLLFCGLMAYVGVVSNVSHGMSLGSSIVAILLLWFVLPRTANSAAGIPVIFAFTGLLGLSLGPILNYYLQVSPQIIMPAVAGTGVIVLALSAYALTTRKDFNFMGAFLMVGLIVVLGAILINMFTQSSVMFLAINAGIILLMSGFILYDTSRIIHGGETNYIMAAASIFLSIINLFQALLHILGAFAGDD